MSVVRLIHVYADWRKVWVSRGEAPIARVWSAGGVRGVPSTMVGGTDPKKVGVEGVVEMKVGRREGLECVF